jgi:hypothetical protein
LLSTIAALFRHLLLQTRWFPPPPVTLALEPENIT